MAEAVGDVAIGGFPGTGRCPFGTPATWAAADAVGSAYQLMKLQHPTMSKELWFSTPAKGFWCTKCHVYVGPNSCHVGCKAGGERLAADFTVGNKAAYNAYCQELVMGLPVVAGGPPVAVQGDNPFPQIGAHPHIVEGPAGAGHGGGDA